MTEKQIILKMVADGKITADEGVKLIKACDQTNTAEDILDSFKGY